MASRSRGLVVALFLAGALIAPVVAGPSASAARSRAGVVLIHGDDSVTVECVSFAGLSAKAIDVLTGTSFTLFTRDYGDFGRAVCYIDGEGLLAEDCFGMSDNWQLFIKKPGGTLKEGKGASFDALVDKTVYYLKYDGAFPAVAPEPHSFKNICGEDV